MIYKIYMINMTGYMIRTQFQYIFTMSNNNFRKKLKKYNIKKIKEEELKSLINYDVYTSLQIQFDNNNYKEQRDDN